MKPRTANTMNIQIFGTKKCNDTKKAQRFFKERGIKFQFIDMKEKGMSKGEFNSVAQVNGGLDNMINWDGKDKDLLALIKYIADVKNGTINAVCLWDPASAGYAMCDLAYKVLSGDEIKEGIDLEQDGYDSVKIQEGVNRCVLGNAPLILNKDNIDDYDF